MMMTAIFAILFIAGLALNLFLQRRQLDRKKVLEALLLNALAIYVGGSGLFAFFGHAFRGEAVAALIGWPPGNPFQLEVAMANLSFGVLGLLCIWFRGDFWLAAGIGYSVFLSGAMVVHLRESMMQGNAQSYNIGLPIVFADVVVPVVLLGLLVAHRLIAKEAENPRR